MNEERKPLDFYTGKMSHVNGDNKIKLNPSSVFTLKDLPSCAYRVAYYLEKNPYISSKVFFNELSFMESMQLYNMSSLIAAEYSGKFVADSVQKQYSINLSRITLLKCTELLCFGNGDNEIDKEAFMTKLLVFATMCTAHFMSLSGIVEAAYENFDINADPSTSFIKAKDSGEKGEVS